MKQTITIHSFRRAFEDMGRDNFSYDGLRVLFEGLEDLENNTGEEYELDVVALCCDFTESTIAEVIEAYSIDVTECEDDDDIREAVLDYLNDSTLVLGEVDGGVVYQNF